MIQFTCVKKIWVWLETGFVELNYILIDIYYSLTGLIYSQTRRLSFPKNKQTKKKNSISRFDNYYRQHLRDCFYL